MILDDGGIWNQSTLVNMILKKKYIYNVPQM